MIPEFRDDGFLPEGLHKASKSEVLFRFGTTTRQRRRLALRLKRWIELAFAIDAIRLVVDGSFVTSKSEPNDIDAVMQIPPNFRQLVGDQIDEAVELESMFLSRQPQEIFAAEDDDDWNAWIEFFSRTRTSDGRRKGLIEIEL
ncbi:MAG: hypothetical protein KDA52_15560 [Planctomycetaceae bacterium]|nr:hypothetical protein [Planctomycetaceae bacterium]